MKLSEIQQRLKAPKGQYNSFGKYKYRSCEDILEAVKPLLGDSILIVTDEIVLIGDRYYVKASAHFAENINGPSTIVNAYAREPLNKKGMDESQITGTASSYARKYALNGLFLIDDTKDADADEHQNQQQKKAELNEKQLEFIDKLKIKLEENSDGKGVDREKLVLMVSALCRGTVPDNEERLDGAFDFLFNDKQKLESLYKKDS